MDVGLRTQIHALKEAKIIFAESTTKEQLGAGDLASLDIPALAAATKSSARKGSMVTGDGLGTLEVGWLNSRNDHVGKQMESDLWRHASEFLDELESRKVSKSHDVDGERAVIE